MKGSIAGRVVDAQGAPVIGASVAISAGTQPHSDIAALTNASGSFRLGNLSPGSYSLAVHGSGHVPAERRVEVAAGRQTDVEIHLDD